MTLRNKLLLIVVGLLLISCEQFTGCGVVTAINAPDPVTRNWYNPITNRTEQVPTGSFYYSVVIKDDSGNTHKIYVSYNTWINARPGSMICVE